MHRNNIQRPKGAVGRVASYPSHRSLRKEPPFLDRVLCIFALMNMLVSIKHSFGWNMRAQTWLQPSRSVCFRCTISPILSRKCWPQTRESSTSLHSETIFQSGNGSIIDKLSLIIPTAEDMEDVGALLSEETGPGDVILLEGDLGAGKTLLSRGFIRARSRNVQQRVTSPTFLLSNAYPTPDGIE